LFYTGLYPERLGGTVVKYLPMASPICFLIEGAALSDFAIDRCKRERELFIDNLLLYRGT